MQGVHTAIQGIEGVHRLPVIYGPQRLMREGFDFWVVWNTDGERHACSLFKPFFARFKTLGFSLFFLLLLELFDKTKKLPIADVSGEGRWALNLPIVDMGGMSMLFYCSRRCAIYSFPALAIRLLANPGRSPRRAFNILGSLQVSLWFQGIADEDVYSQFTVFVPCFLSPISLPSAVSFCRARLVAWFEI